MSRHWPVRVEVDEPGITAILPLSNLVEIVEDLPDGGAMVLVKLKSGERRGRMSAETLAERNDWNLNIEVIARRTLKAERDKAQRDAELEKMFRNLDAHFENNRKQTPE